MTYPQAFPPPPGPPSAPVPPPRRRKRWPLFGVIAVVVVLAGVGVTLYATGVFGAEGGDGQATGQDASVSPSVKELSSPSAPAETAKYRHNNHVCTDVDWGALEKAADLKADDVEEDYQPVPGSATVTCKVKSDDQSAGYDFELRIFDTVAAAAEEYESLKLDKAEAADGPWEQVSWLSGADDESAYSYLHAQDSNVYMSFHAGIPGGDSEKDVEEAVTEVGESVFAAITVEE